MLYCGIDPDVDKSGVAVWDKIQKKIIYLEILDFFDLIDFFKTYQFKKIIIEAGWLIKKSNWHKSESSKVDQAIARDVGRNHEVGMKIEEYCKKNNLPYELKKPVPIKRPKLASKSKRNPGKVSSEEFYKLTKIKTKNQEKIDAGMLVFGY